jgi:DNA repair exonuclease SbcCD nuclease subunit
VKRFLIISDIHACDVDPTASDAPSYVSSYGGRRASADPLSELEALIEKDIPEVDYILCPGDIANRANPSAFAYAWKSLNDLADRLKIPLFATVGNHDIDSRYKTNTFDPMEFAKNITPHIPTRKRPQYLEYWAENFTLIENDDCNNRGESARHTHMRWPIGSAIQRAGI